MAAATLNPYFRAHPINAGHCVINVAVIIAQLEESGVTVDDGDGWRPSAALLFSLVTGQ